MNQWSDSKFIETCQLYENGDIEKSFELFQAGAEEGDASCMVWLRVLYGDGVKEDQQNQNEIYWYKKAFENNDFAAANNLAIVYKNQSKLAEAEHWFNVAIQNGDGDANLELAKMYISINQNTGKIKGLLQATIKNANVTECSIEEARRLIKKYA